MMEKMFVDINVIQSVPPSCVNRDDTGSPKTAVYGGVRRARVSSQSWKKAVRDEFRSRFDESELSVRTLRIVEMVADRIQVIDSSVTREDAIAKAADVLEKGGVKVKAKTKSKKKADGEENQVPEAQALFFMSSKQADNLAALAIEGEYDKKAVEAALNKGHGVEIALFGRMVADNPLMNADASCQVSHSISTHRVDNEFDFYTAVDDHAPEDNSGAGMIGTVEFNSSTLYRYATVAVHDLQRILEDKDVTTRALTEFIRAFALSMPTGKQNTFANRTIPYALYIVVRADQPVNLVGAFERPVAPDADGGYNRRSAERMVEYEKMAESDFIDAPVVSWQVGEGLDGAGSASSLQEALEGLSALLAERL